MAFEDEFLDVMVDTIIWEKMTGTDEYGNRQYAAPVRIQCRVAPKSVQILDTHGNDILSKAAIYTAGDFPITADDKITQANGEADPVLRVARPPDGDGAHHVEVTI
jgi:hypothetical protein